MATKDHSCLSLKGNNQQFGSSNQNGHQYSNLNLNENQKCSLILETFQSNKSISTTSNSKKNDYENCSSSWNKSRKNNVGGGNIYSNDSNVFGSNDKTSKKWKSKSPNSKKSGSSSNSTLSIHITAYENSIEAQNGLNSSSAADDGKKDGTNLSKRKINKVLEVFKSGFASMDAFEIPRQQTTEEDKNELEIMAFKAKQKLLNPNQQSPPTVTSESYSSSTSCEEAVAISRDALGEVVSIGSLYNAPRGCFTTTSAYTSDIKNHIITTPIGSNSYEYIYEKSLSGKLKKLEIDANMALNILCGVVKVKGQGKYLLSSASNGRKITYSVIFKRVTLKEEINVNDEEVKSRLCVDAIKNSKATHINTETYYGACAIINVTYEREENENEEEVKAKLEAAVKFIGKIDIGGGGQLNNREHDSNIYKKFEVRAYYHGHLPDGERLPTTIEEADAFIKKVPSWATNSNGGKGVPFLYKFIPSSYLPNYGDIELTHTISVDINEDIIIPLFEVFNEMSHAKKQLTLLETEFEKLRKFVPDNVLQGIKSKKNEIRIKKREIKRKIREIKTEVHRGQKSVDSMSEIVDEYNGSELTHLKIEKFCQTFIPSKVKIEYIKRLQKKDIIFVGKGTSLEYELMKHGDPENYFVFYCKWADKFNLKENCELFLKLADEGHKLVFTDLDANPEAANENVPAGNQIYKYVHRQLVDRDCLQTHKINHHNNDIEPFNVKEITAQNEARNIILTATRVLVDITRIVQYELHDLQKRIKKWDDYPKLKLSCIEESDQKDKIQKRINESLAIFAHFLKSTSIIPYNGAIENYLKLSIEDVTREDLIKPLEQQLKQFEVEKKILDDRLATGEARKIQPADIEKLQKELENLPIYGRTFKELYDAHIRKQQFKKLWSDAAKSGCQKNYNYITKQ